MAVDNKSERAASGGGWHKGVATSDKRMNNQTMFGDKESRQPTMKGA